MALRSGFRKDKGSGGFVHVDKKLIFEGSSWIEQTGSVSIFEDFISSPDTILTQSPNYLVTQAGSPLTAGIITATGGGTASVGHGGWIGGKTDDVDANIVDEISLGGTAAAGWMLPSRAGNGMLVCEIGFVIPTALTARQYFAGLSDDAIEGTSDGALNISGTYTTVAQADDAAGFIFSSLATAPTIWKYASSAATVVSAASAAKEAVTGTVDAYTVCRVEVDSAGNAFFYQSTSGSTAIGRQAPVYVGSTVSAVTPTVLLLPKFDAAATTTTGVEWEIDYMFGACAR